MNAPGRGEFNRTKCQMAKFSQQLSGIVLSHYKFGSHLNSKGKAIDPEKEKKSLCMQGRS